MLSWLNCIVWRKIQKELNIVTTESVPIICSLLAGGAQWWFMIDDNIPSLAKACWCDRWNTMHRGMEGKDSCLPWWQCQVLHNLNCAYSSLHLQHLGKQFIYSNLSLYFCSSVQSVLVGSHLFSYTEFIWWIVAMIVFCSMVNTGSNWSCSGGNGMLRIHRLQQKCFPFHEFSTFQKGLKLHPRLPTTCGHFVDLCLSLFRQLSFFFLPLYKILAGARVL